MESRAYPRARPLRGLRGSSPQIWMGQLRTPEAHRDSRPKPASWPCAQGGIAHGCRGGAWNPLPHARVAAQWRRRALVRVPKGAIYTRRSASKQIMTAVDFEALVERRLQRFRSKILEGVARVVAAPPHHEIVTVVRGEDALGAATVTIADAPASIDLRGKPLKLVSNSILDKISLYRGVTQSDERIEVPRGFLYEVFVSRNELKLDGDIAEWLAFHSLKMGAPCFVWLRGMKRSAAQEIIKRAFEASPYWRKQYILRYSGFYGERFFNLLRDRLKDVPRVPVMQFRPRKELLNVDASRYPDEDENKATELAQLLMREHNSMQEHELEKLDCALYAPFD